MSGVEGQPPLLELRGIVKRFGQVVANDRVDLTVAAGEILALVGENGAGKTTLMQIAFGLLQPDAGEIRVDGVRQRFSSALGAIGAGLGMVHQHFMLFPDLTVTENIVFGAEPSRLGLVEREVANQRVQELAERHRFQVGPSAVVRDLSVGARQQVEILKALYREARILILDEPTAVLGPEERKSLFTVLESLSQQGTAVVLITHKLREVMRIADRATVMRDGAVVGTVEVSVSSVEEISRMMTGRELTPPPARVEQLAGGPRLQAEGLCVETPSGRRILQDVSLEVDAGEIVGVAGAAGKGQRELVEALAGARPVASGSIRIADEILRRSSIASRRRLGMAWMPDDRDGTGATVEGSVLDNLIMGSEDRPDLAQGRRLRRAACERFAAAKIREYGIKCAGPRARMFALSGGNRQKVVLARELPLASAVLLSEQPTRGLDLRAAADVHRRLLEYRAEGGAVLMVSSDLGELLDLADRILVMFEGRVVGRMRTSEATEERLGLLMSGALAEAMSG
ncbi:MAG: ABC transporter ATP-binding protein [Acidobacteriota bacterium]